MRTTLVFLFIITFFVNSGCNKTKNCKCTTTYSGTGSAAKVTKVETVTNKSMNGGNANPDCEAMNFSSTDSAGLTTTKSCVRE